MVRVPATRERVGVEGRDGVFLVVWVDADQQTADLIPLIEGDGVLTVPFAQIRHMQEARVPISLAGS